MAKKASKSKKSEVNAVPTPAAMLEKEHDYQGEDDFRTLLRAKEIEDDEERMKRVHKHVTKHKKAISSISELKKKAAERREELAEESAEEEA